MIKILDGKRTAAEIRQQIAGQIHHWAVGGGAQPCLAAVLVGDDPASAVYVRNKQRACEAVGMVSQLRRFAKDVSQSELLAEVQRLNRDPQVHGILVQLPLPSHIDSQQVLDAIDPRKDVDCFHPVNLGLLMQGRPRFLPCTPHGVLRILKAYQLPTAGKHVVVVGRSEIVGKPMASLLMQKDGPLGSDYANATVTVCHSRSTDLETHLKQADVVIAAVGQPQMIQGSSLKLGAVVVDVGINRTPSGLVGDVDFSSAAMVASAITPVPGGVGPLTVAMLLDNTLQAARGLQEVTPSPSTTTTYITEK